MQIRIRLPAEVGPSQHPLPPSLAKIGANETVIIELQGSIEIEGEKFGELIGNLDVTNIVCSMYFYWFICSSEYPEEIRCHYARIIRVNKRNKHVPSLSIVYNHWRFAYLRSRRNPRSRLPIISSKES